MQTLLQNLRFSLRLLGRNPGLTITVLLTVALGIGANTAIFTVDYATLLAPLPFPQPNQLVMVWSSIQGNRNGVAAVSYTHLDVYKRQVPVFLLNLCARLPFVVLLVSVVVGMILGHGRHACQRHSQDG